MNRGGPFVYCFLFFLLIHSFIQSIPFSPFIRLHSGGKQRMSFLRNNPHSFFLLNISNKPNPPCHSSSYPKQHTYPTKKQTTTNNKEWQIHQRKEKEKKKKKSHTVKALCLLYEYGYIYIYIKRAKNSIPKNRSTFLHSPKKRQT